MFVLIIITVSITPQRYGCFLIHQNFLLFFSSKVHFFLFFPVWWYSDSVFICPAVMLSIQTQFAPAFIRLFWDYRVYNNYISLLKNKSLLVFRFFLAGHLQGHFSGAFSGAFSGTFKGHFRLLGAFSRLTWAFIQGQ